MRLKHKIDPLRFIKVTTPEIAYVLGFLWADGYLGANYSINTEIVSDDAIVIEKIFLSTGQWHIFQRHRIGYRPQTKFSCNSKVLYEHLVLKGFKTENKSPLDLLKTIPKKLHRYWFRGYFDGDGCWYFNAKNYLRQCTISSRYEQNWDFMVDLFQELQINQYNLNQQNKKNKKGIINSSSQVRLCSVGGIKSFGYYIYGGKMFGLDRKFNKFQEMIL